MIFNGILTVLAVLAIGLVLTMTLGVVATFTIDIFTERKRHERKADK